MKIQYKHQGFQREATLSVTDAFMGQPKSDGISNFIVDQGKNKKLFDVEGFGNEPVARLTEQLNNLTKQ